jgi:hypothetical protein
MTSGHPKGRGSNAFSVTLNTLTAAAYVCRTTGETSGGPSTTRAKQRRAKSAFQFPLTPSVLNGDTDVELTFFRAFALSKDDQVMGPRQLSYQWCDFLVPVVGFVKLPHANKLARVKPRSPG